MTKEMREEKFEKDGELFDEIALENGDVLELCVSALSDQVKRYYVRDKNGDVIEFGDPEKYGQISDEVITMIKHHLEEDGIIITDQEAGKIALAINEREFARGFNPNKDMAH